MTVHTVYSAVCSGVKDPVCTVVLRFDSQELTKALRPETYSKEEHLIAFYNMLILIAF